MSNPSLCAASEIRPISAHEFEQIRRLAYEQFGLDLRNGKEPLVSARLGKQMRQLNLRTFQDYLRHVKEDQTGEALVGLMNALTTNYTSFFREPAHFDFMRQVVLPRVRDRDRISIWSAACSSGEEPYSIAFCLLEELGETVLPRVHILATDLSTRVLDTARQAIYAADRFDGIPPFKLSRYLLRGEGRNENHYRVKPAVCRAVEFRRLNLMDQCSHLGPFPLIFCRNVMIYFDKPTQEALVNRLAGCLEPGGYLLIGHSESLSNVKHSLRYVAPAIYQKTNAREEKSGRSDQ